MIQCVGISLFTKYWAPLWHAYMKKHFFSQPTQDGFLNKSNVIWLQHVRYHLNTYGLLSGIQPVNMRHKLTHSEILWPVLFHSQFFFYFTNLRWTSLHLIFFFFLKEKKQTKHQGGMFCPIIWSTVHLTNVLKWTS